MAWRKKSPRKKNPLKTQKIRFFPCQSTGHICHEPAFANQVGKATEDTHIITHSETCLRTELLLKADISCTYMKGESCSQGMAKDKAFEPHE